MAICSHWKLISWNLSCNRWTLCRIDLSNNKIIRSIHGSIMFWIQNPSIGSTFNNKTSPFAIYFEIFLSFSFVWVSVSEHTHTRAHTLPCVSIEGEITFKRRTTNETLTHTSTQTYTHTHTHSCSTCSIEMTFGEMSNVDLTVRFCSYCNHCTADGSWKSCKFALNA